jgi:hypothetical protein
VTPAFGQAVASPVGPSGSANENGASIPDFSGRWDHGISPDSSRWHRVQLRWSTGRAARTAPAPPDGGLWAITPIRS